MTDNPGDGGMEWRGISDWNLDRDGRHIIAWCVHHNAKYSKDPIKDGWEAAVRAEWIDHNGGGWTWEGLAGRFTHYLLLSDLPPPPSQAQTEGDGSGDTAKTGFQKILAGLQEAVDIATGETQPGRVHIVQVQPLKTCIECGSQLTQGQCPKCRGDGTP